MDVQHYKDALLKKRTEILGTGGIKPLQASMENNTRQGDMADQASGNNEVHIQLKLKQTDAKILQAIEEALWRIEKGHLRRVPRLRRADCRSATERHSVDARLHRVQGKAERVTDLVSLLQAFHHDKLADLLRHQAGARLVGQYDANNAYQYIISREETELSWLEQAIAELEGTVNSLAAEPDRRPSGSGREKALAIFAEDAREAQAFVERWRPRVEAMTNARHRLMLRVILGEALEQKRFFEQALAGQTDLLGRRTDDVGPRIGEVLPTRWIE